MHGAGWATDWSTLWPAMRTIRAAGRLGSALHSILFVNNLGKKRPALSSLKIQWRHFRDATFRMFLLYRKPPARRGANDSFSSEFLVRGAQRHSSPGIQDPEAVASNVEPAASRTP